MNTDLTSQYRIHNYLHTVLLLAGMLLLMALIGWLIAGFVGVFWSLLSGVVIFLTVPRLSPRIILSLYGARPLYPEQLPQLYEILYWLSKQTDVKAPPRLYYVPSQTMLAFSVGMNSDTAIALSNTLLQTLNTRELTGVLAHEISHIQSRDLWVMAIADVISRMTSIMAMTGYLMIMIYLPMFLFTDEDVPWMLLIVLMLAPNLSALMQLALSRTREYDADVKAVRLTGDPIGLASALNKIEHYQENWLKRILMPGLRMPEPSLLRTHPVTEERVKRLLAMEGQYQSQHPFSQPHGVNGVPGGRANKPRRRWTGLWH